MPLLDHLTELRNRLLWSIVAIAIAFVVAYQFKVQIYRFLAQPLANIFAGEQGRKMIATGLTEIFFPYLVATPALFLMGAALAYYVVIPFAFHFFVSFEAPPVNGSLPIEIEAKV